MKKCEKTEIKKEIEYFLELNYNENAVYPNLCGTMKMCLKDKFIMLGNYIRNLRDFIPLL